MRNIACRTYVTRNAIRIYRVGGCAEGILVQNCNYAIFDCAIRLAE